MIDYEITTEDCLIEMFKRVGETYPNPELTDRDDWYMQRTWTIEEEKDFKEWMKVLLKKRYKYLTSLQIDAEIAMFLLMWGWTTR